MVACLAAGYQGPTSILTSALLRFVDELDPGRQVHSIQPDVTLNGESARSLFDSVEQGRRQVCYLASGYLAERVPLLSLLDLPFMVSRREHALAALDADVGEALACAIHQATGLRVLGFWDNGFRHLTNGRHAIRSPADCRGLTVRTLDSADCRAAMSALGFEARSIDVRDLVRAVESAEVDAQENPLTNFVNFGLWRHHRYVSLTSHQFGVCLFVCHGEWFDRQSDSERAAIVDAARKATALQRALAVGEDRSAIEFLSGADVEVLAAGDLDLEAMKRCCRPLVAQRRAVLPQALVQHYLSNI